MEKEEIIDSYEQFLAEFNISKDAFYSFGLATTIFSPKDKAEEQWRKIKDNLFSDEKLAIRPYGGQGKNTRLYVDLYKSLFGNCNIYEDNNNTVPKKNIQEAIDCKVKKIILNYQCSHIFGRTKNPLLFGSVWNICFSPKIFDPLTGHETKGEWPAEYKKRLLEKVFKMYENIICEYNELLVEQNIGEKICNYIINMRQTDTLSKPIIDAFSNRAQKEWEPIILDKELGNLDK